MRRVIRLSKTDYFIAVYDIGKTNKKFTIFTSDLKPVYSTYERIGEKIINGVICDDAEAMIGWMKGALRSAPNKDKIKSIAITTFGATGVLLNKEGKLAFPIVSYNHEIDPNTRREFYDTFGSPEELYIRTGTPPYGQLLNFGIQLFWHRKVHPKIYQRTRYILFLPQYLSYIMTGVKSIEITSVGCHTYLYDIINHDWSIVAKDLNIPSKVPEIFTEVWRPIGRALWLKGAIVTTGIHDSNASLIPFLITGEIGNFILASTGTWCVFMYPGLTFKPAKDDVYRDVLYYIDAFSRPVRSSRFKGGYEFDHYVNLIQKRFNLDPSILNIEVNEQLLRRILKEKEVFIVPTLTPGSGQFPKSKGRIIGKRKFYSDPKLAYHVLNLSIAIQTYFAINAILRGKPLRGIRIIVAGGFAKNNMYLKLLATILRNAKILRAGYADLTSLGAAITAKSAYEGISLNEIDKELIKSIIAEEIIEPLEIEDNLILDYINAFEAHCLSNISDHS